MKPQHFTHEQIIRAIQLAKAERARKLIAMINSELTDLQLVGGPKNQFIAEGPLLRAILKEFPEISKRWDTLQFRKEVLKRIIFKNA